jgi:hypothetical protein
MKYTIHFSYNNFGGWYFQLYLLYITEVWKNKRLSLAIDYIKNDHFLYQSKYNFKEEILLIINKVRN